MECYFRTHTHDKDLRAQYAAENKQKLEVVSVPAKASSASKPSGATEPNVSENKRKLEASGEAVQKAMRGGRKQLQDEAKNDGGVMEVDDWFEEMEGVIDEGVQLEEMEDVCLLYTSPSPRDKRQSRMPSSA